VAIATSSGEKILFETRQHPIVFATPAAVLLLGLIIRGGFGGFLIFVGVVFGLVTLLEYMTSVYTVTTHRVVAKWGVFGRHSMDLRINLIDSMQERTTLLGLVFGAFGFGYATVAVTSSGGNAILVQKVFKPKEFVATYHQAATDLVENVRGMAQHAEQRAAIAGASACASCGQLNAAGTVYCGSCGAALAAKCPACGEMTSSRFCGKCGVDTTALPAGAVPQQMPA